MIGISMASVSSPSSGSWKATESKVASVRKRGESRPKTAITATSASPRPMFSAPSFAASGARSLRVALRRRARRSRS